MGNAVATDHWERQQPQCLTAKCTRDRRPRRNALSRVIGFRAIAGLRRSEARARH